MLCRAVKSPNFTTMSLSRIIMDSPLFVFRNKEIRRAGEIRSPENQTVGIPLSLSAGRGAQELALPFWVRVAQSRLAQSGSATAAEASAQ